MSRAIFLLSFFSFGRRRRRARPHTHSQRTKSCASKRDFIATPYQNTRYTKYTTANSCGLLRPLVDYANLSQLIESHETTRTTNEQQHTHTHTKMEEKMRLDFICGD